MRSVKVSNGIVPWTLKFATPRDVQQRMPTTLGELFPGKMGRVELTRVAIRIRRPDLLKMPPHTILNDELTELLRATQQLVAKG